MAVQAALLFRFTSSSKWLSTFIECPWHFRNLPVADQYAVIKDLSEEEAGVFTLTLSPEQLAALEPMLTEGCAGQLPEIYDGGVPAEGKGCFAQAWSVGEMLRVFETIETIEHK